MVKFPRISFFAVAILAVVSLASCGTVDFQSERSRSVTNERDQRDMGYRADRARAQAAAKTAEAVSKGWHVK